MEQMTVSKSVRKIVVLRRDEHGHIVPVTLFDRAAGKKRKTSRLLRPVEKMTRRWAEAQQAAADDYLERHKRSSSKKKDGWIRDYPTNLLKAANRGRKQLKLRQLPAW
jgi:hypothetical protein